MELTHEQHRILQTKGDINIHAVAGSGKTTTIIEYAKTRKAGSRILYLAFNKSVKEEAIKKMAQAGVNHVQVETAHSLAFKYIVYHSAYEVQSQAYTTHQIAQLLGLQGNGEKHTEHIIANHINKCMAFFCNSAATKVQEVNYLDTVTEPTAKEFVTEHYTYIEQQTRLLLAKMNRAEIAITHDFYLKKFQLSNPILPYDYILFDEGQDASAVMLAIFLQQPATKIMVGDAHQQIYGWRYAVNALQQTGFTPYSLSNSFRFGADIAQLAMQVLDYKFQLGSYMPVSIQGCATPISSVATKAVIARTNLGLLLKSIEYVTQKNATDTIYFEGNINSYTYAEEGASLYDVLHLYNQQHGKIRDSLIKAMHNMHELEDYIEKTEDVQLGMMVQIVNEYGNDIFNILKQIKEKHVAPDQKSKANIIFSTVHRCKGLEYDVIELVNDFITPKKIEQQLDNCTPEETPSLIAKLNEEINLLYVAVTRAKKTIFIPESMVPSNCPASPNIKILKTPVKQPATPTTIQKATVTKSGNISAAAVTVVTANHTDAYKPWTPELDAELTELFLEGFAIKNLAIHFGRTAGAVQSRLKKLSLYPQKTID